MKKRTVAWLLSGLMLVNLMAGAAFAAEDVQTEQDTAVVSSEVLLPLEDSALSEELTPNEEPAPSEQPVLSEEAQAVQDAIAALPDTLEMNRALDVRAANQGFEALSAEEQNALPTEQTDKLFALMQELETAYAFESGNSKWKVEDSADITLPTTSGIEVDISHLKEDGYVLYTIPKDFSTPNIHINAYEDIMEMSEGKYVPGYSASFTVKINNLSDTVYNYKKNSFYVSSKSQHGVYEEGDSSFEYLVQDGWIDGAVGYEGNHLLAFADPSKNPPYVINRTFNVALQNLYEWKSPQPRPTAKDLTDEKVGEKLAAKGYGNGIADLNRYYMDFLNQQNQTDYAKLEDFANTEIKKLFSGNATYIPETNPEVAELGHNFFYNVCLMMLPQGESTSEQYSVGAWARNQTPFEDTMQAILASIEQGMYEIPALRIAISGPYATNAFQNYRFEWSFGFDLTMPVGTISGTVFNDTSRDNSYTDADATLAGSTVTLQQKNENGEWAAVEGKTVTTDATGIYHFADLLPGEYRVTATRPSGVNRDCSMTWSADALQDNRFTSVDGVYATDVILVEAESETIANAGFYYYSSGGGGGGDINIPDPEVPLAPGLDKDDHFAYIIGYPIDFETGEPTTDKTRWPVRPEAQIDRQEVATIFFRLLTEESRLESWKQTNDFSDVSAKDWSNNAISTMANAEIVNGYEDGSFRPQDSITRAEFATIAARFDSSLYVGEDRFSDISGHWAAEYINRAAQKGWIQGYEDGTFRPDQYITRAEAMTLVNNVLDRRTRTADMLVEMMHWQDNPAGTWYYEAVQEATNGHDYDRENPTAYEKWTKMQQPRDWALLEREWSVAAANYEA